MEGEKDRIVINLLRLGAFLQREGGRIIGDLGLNQQQFVVLKQIEFKGPLNQTEIRSKLLLEKSNLSKIVKKLIESRFVRKTTASHDSRVCMLSITKRGKRAADEGMSRYNKWNQSWLKSLTEREVKQALRSLDRLYGLM